MNKTFLLALALLAGCGPSQRDYDQARNRAVELEGQVAALRAELEEVKFGAPHLLNQAKAATEAKKDEEARALLTELLSRHPSSAESKEAALLLAQVESRTAAARQHQKREEERRVQEARAMLERATRNMERRTDDIKGITWVSHRNAPVLGKYVSLYFGSKDGSAAVYPLRLKVQYSGDDWLFVRSLIVKADDKVYELGGLEFERDHSAGSVWEWIDMPVKDHAMVDHWMTAKRVVVRFNGDKYYSDFALPERQQVQMREVYEAWKSMGGSP
ncbi:MAG TPA: hypothetical protein VF017_15840 [Thermoanaerobaculia bacterium]|nr:hypothetical protein [Thermoanaerobaculia bacterium]